MRDRERARHHDVLYRDLFDRAPDAYVVTDAVGTIIDANAAATSLVGEAPGVLPNRSLEHLVDGEDVPRLRSALRQLRHERIVRAELRVHTSDGRRIVDASAVADPSDPPEELLVRWILRDVTERVRAEAEVKALNAELDERIHERTRELGDLGAELETLVRAMPQAVLLVGPDRQLRLANRSAELLFAATFDEIAAAVRDQSWQMFTAEGVELERSARPLVHALETGERTTDQRLLLEREDGELLLVEVTATPIRGAGGVTSVLMTYQDVTERDRRERAEREFVTNAAHELQTPIAAITSAVEVLQSGAKERPEDRDRFLEHVEHATERLGRLTRALLALARAQTRDEVPRTEVLALEPLLRSIATVLPTRDVVVECAADVAVIANRPLLEQAIVNLGENAAKHGSSRVVLAGRPVDGDVAIEVRDGGPGIPVEDRQRLFGRFVRGDTTAPGFGLGLAIVREAVDALDGELVLETNSVGTRVSIVLPGARVRTT